MKEYFPSSFILHPSMRPWTTEYGTLWALETSEGLPPRCQARIEVTCEEIGDDDVGELAAAMGLPNSEPIKQRFQGNGRPQGKRRCFCLRIAGRADSVPDQTIAAYGWVTHGVERVGELERQFNLCDDEAYIWDCVTLPAWRGQRLYSALLSHLIYQLHGEEVPRIWIGASRQNKPSIRGIANAGFQHVVDVTYHRLLRLTFFWIHEALSARRPLLAAAYRILINEHEWRLGRLAVGFLVNSEQ